MRGATFMKFGLAPTTRIQFLVIREPYRKKCLKCPSGPEAKMPKVEKPRPKKKQSGKHPSEIVLMQFHRAGEKGPEVAKTLSHAESQGRHREEEYWDTDKHRFIRFKKAKTFSVLICVNLPAMCVAGPSPISL
jgi:hypothetical protein